MLYDESVEINQANDNTHKVEPVFYDTRKLNYVEMTRDRERQNPAAHVFLVV